MAGENKERACLPVEAVLPDLAAALSAHSNAVLIAPPGAGKTTAAAPALLEEAWCDGQIWLLSPRRLAARAAAERIAENMGEAAGGTVGYLTRMDSKMSAATRILVMTEGVFRTRIIADPELSGVSAVLFDEVHERSINGDFGLALALEAQEAFRPDLRIVPMSATLDGARFAALLNDARVIESAGKAHLLDYRHIGRKPEQPVEDAVADAVRRALREEAAGDVLAFLPGVREIERTAERLDAFSKTHAVHMLHGSLMPEEQRAAIQKDAAGRRKIILATSIAETSLTIDGVRIVVDSGLSRRARFDRSAGVTRLVTERVSAASAVQRAGRAARQCAGVAYRLWEEAATGGLVPFDPPEIMESDLAPLLLDCGLWGENDPQRLRWLDAPPAAGVNAARRQLGDLGALNQAGGLTDKGRMLGALPLPPALANMLLEGAMRGQADLAAALALLVQERGLGGRGEDLAQRLDRLHTEKGARAAAAKAMARRWAKDAQKLAASHNSPSISAAGLLALAFPDRIAKRADKQGASWRSAGGRAFKLDDMSPLTSADWLVIAQAQGAAASARIFSAIAIAEAELFDLFAHQIAEKTHVFYDRAADRVSARRERRLGNIALSKGQDAAPDNDVAAQLLLDAVRQYGLALLPWGKLSSSLRTRGQYAGLERLSDSSLLADAPLWLGPLLHGKKRLAELSDAKLAEALEGYIGWDEMQAVAALAPPHFTSPAGTRHAIDYGADGGPMVEARVQAFFGLAAHPLIGRAGIALRLSLTSPAGRPIQTTADLPGFWAGSWQDVKKEMRGRYPRHHWPDDPTAAAASLATKKRQGL